MSMDWNLLLTVVSLAMNVIVTIALFYIGSKTAKIDQLEHRLGEAADRRIDEKFAAQQAQCAMRHVTLDKWLEAGDAHFREARESEKSMARDIADIRENMATRQDLNRMADQIETLAR